MTELKTISPDADIESADWTKQSWDLPPYKSAEFMKLHPNLSKFRRFQVYKHAVANRLIVDDEWVGNAALKKAAKKKGLNQQVVGNAGLYYCCYQLSLLGWNVMPTARNARGVDIIAYNEDATKMLAVQVKTLSKRSPVPLGSSLEKVMGDVWVVINNVASPTPNVFILSPEEVKALAYKNQTGQVAYWLQPKDYDKDEFRDKWVERFGKG